jgi:Double zinc ribbon
MDCPKCNSANDDAQRFCSVCGTALGNVCKRCGTAGKHEAKYCGMCGTAFVSSGGQQRLFSRAAITPTHTPRQYTPEEIEDLLSLQVLARQEAQNSEQLSQKDLDSLFQKSE